MWPPTGDALPSFYPDSKRSILGLLNEGSLVSEFFWEDSKIVYQLLGGLKHIVNPVE